MKRLPFVILTLLSFPLLAYLLYFTDPNSSWHANIYVTDITVRVVSVFLILLSFFLFSFCTLILQSKKHGLLIALFAVSYLVFRLNELTHPFFLVLLASIFITLELLLSYKKDRRTHTEA